MIIVISSLFFVLALFFNSIELSSEEFYDPLRTLHILNPTYFKFLRWMTNERLFDFDENTKFVARGETLIGWLAGSIIEPLYDQKGNYIIFQMNQKQVKYLAKDQLMEWGVFNDFSSLMAKEIQEAQAAEAARIEAARIEVDRRAALFARRSATGKRGVHARQAADREYESQVIHPVYQDMTAHQAAFDHAASIYAIPAHPGARRAAYAQTAGTSGTSQAEAAQAEANQAAAARAAAARAARDRRTQLRRPD